jgi:hypothetical protein
MYKVLIQVSKGEKDYFLSKIYQEDYFRNKYWIPFEDITFKKLENAKKLEKEAISKGYNTMIITI